MERKFTSEVYNEYVNTIKNIDQNECGFIDFFTDIGKWFSELIGILDIENYLDNISTYHKIVLDQHNISITELNQIFLAVQTADFNRCKNLDQLLELTTQHSKSLDSLTELLAPGAAFTATAVTSAGAAIEERIAQSCEQVDRIICDTVRQREIDLVIDSAKEWVGNTLSFAGGVVATVGYACSGNMLKAANSLRKTTNSLTAGLCDLGAMAHVGIGYGYSKITGDSTSRIKMVEDGQKFNEIEDLADYFEYYGFNEKLVNGLRAVDFLGDSYSLFSGFSGDYCPEDANGNPLKGAEKAKEIIKHIFVGKNDVFDYPDGDYDYIKNAKDRINDLRTLWGFAEVTIDTLTGEPDQNLVDSLIDKYAKNTGTLGEIKDAADLVSDIDDIISNPDAFESRRPESYMEYNPKIDEWVRKDTNRYELEDKYLESLRKEALRRDQASYRIPV